MSSSLLRQALSRPSLYMPATDFFSIATFVQGFDLAGSGGPLVGVREWLIAKLGYGNNLAWPELVLHLVFPDAESPRKELSEESNQKLATESLTRLLEEFWLEREKPDGLRRIYLRYEGWLKRQDWTNKENSKEEESKSTQLK